MLVFLPQINKETRIFVKRHLEVLNQTRHFKFGQTLVILFHLSSHKDVTIRQGNPSLIVNPNSQLVFKNKNCELKIENCLTSSQKMNNLFSFYQQINS